MVAHEEKLAQAATQTGEASKRSTAESASGFEMLEGKVKGIAMGIVGAYGVNWALGTLRDQFDRTAEAGQKFVDGLSESLGRISQIGQWQKVVPGLEKAPGMETLDVPQRGQLYAEIVRRVPDIDVTRAIGLAGQAGRRHAITRSMDLTMAFTGVEAEIARMKPQATVQEVSSIAALLMRRAVDPADAIQAMRGVQQLIEQGMPIDQALGVALASLEARQGGRGISRYAAYLDEAKKAEVRDAEEARKHPFLARSPAMPAAPGSVVETVQAQMRARDYAGMVAAAAGRDIVAEEYETGMRIPEIRGRARTVAAQAGVEAARAGHRVTTEAIGTARALAEERMERENTWAPAKALSLAMLDLLGWLSSSDIQKRVETHQKALEANTKALEKNDRLPRSEVLRMLRNGDIE